MSTRANIIIRDELDIELIFYRHSDGYPEVTMPTLEKFLGWVKEGRIRDDAAQAAGWLILIGADEYANRRGRSALEPGPAGDVYGWKCGAYEPTFGIHGDIEYLYVVDLGEKVIKIHGQDGYTYEGQFSNQGGK